ncbi:MAG: hypothetical protein HY693_03745 [Deltaproteobacteria bacterium]|nr:hypothetical protein [Deltaproteobacteria bacterium]
MDNIKEDISRLRTDLAELSKQVKDKGKVYAKSTTDKVLASIGKELDKLGDDKDRVLEKLRVELENVQEMGKQKVESVEQKIQENPLKSLLIAFIAGLFLGKIFDRK